MQGGLLPNEKAWSWYTATLNKEFTTSSYTLTSGLGVDDGEDISNMEANGVQFGKRNLSSFRWRQLDNRGNPFGYWVAFGY